MCMKIQKLSSSCRSKTRVEACAPGRLCSPRPDLRRAGREQVGRCTAVGVGNGNNQHVEEEDKKSCGESQQRKKDVKNEGRTDYVYENEGTNDNLPDGTHDICAGRSLFYTEMHVFCRNRRAFATFRALENAPAAPKIHTERRKS